MILKAAHRKVGWLFYFYMYNHNMRIDLVDMSTINLMYLLYKLKVSPSNAEHTINIMEDHMSYLWAEHVRWEEEHARRMKELGNE